MRGYLILFLLFHINNSLPSEVGVADVFDVWGGRVECRHQTSECYLVGRRQAYRLHSLHRIPVETFTNTIINTQILNFGLIVVSH